MSIEQRREILEHLESSSFDIADLEVLVAHLQQRLQADRDRALGGGKLVWVEPDEAGWLVRRSLLVCCEDGVPRLDGPFDYRLSRDAGGSLHWRLLGRTADWD